MSFIGKLLGTDKAVEGIKNVAEAGVKMWDMSKFTPQEQVGAFTKLASITGDRETAISRRIIAWALMGIITFSFAVGLIWVSYDAFDKVDKMILLLEKLWIGQGFTAAIAFYFLTHCFGALKK